MRVHGTERLSEFMRKHPRARSPLAAWLAEARDAMWDSPLDVRNRYPSVSIINGHYIFNIGGNRYRLDTLINFPPKIVLALRVGTHTQYNSWNFS